MQQTQSLPNFLLIDKLDLSSSQSSTLCQNLGTSSVEILKNIPMNQLGFIINFSLSLFIVSALAQATTKHNSNIFRWNLAIVIGVLSFVFIFIFVIIIYANFFHITVPAILTNYRGLDEQTYSSSKLGLDKAVIGSLPSFRFSSLKGSKEGLECTICISIFQDNEVLRLLPNCKHAFHKNCIDEWLERKSSCPLCRYKFKVEDFSRFTFPNDLGVHCDPSNLTEDANFEVFVQREEEPLETTSKFRFGSSFKKFVKAKKEAALIQEGNHCGYDLGKVLLDKFKHKIIVSDIVYKRRWSDLNSSDLLRLSSEMISITSSQRFSPSNDHITLRIDDSEVSNHLNLGSSSPTFSSLETNKSITSRLLLNPAEMRSMSEITSFARFKKISKRNSNEESTP